MSIRTKLGRRTVAGALALTMLLGATGPPAVQVASAQEPTETIETDGGFDWGLLGLLGLLGLAGLLRRPERPVTPVDRTTTARPIVDDRP